MKRMTFVSELKFLVTCANCQDWVQTYQWSLRECFNENIMECVHCGSSYDEMFLPSTGNFIKIDHSNTAGWAYYAVVVKVTLQNPSKDEGMTSFIYQYYDDTKVVCQVSPITGQAITTPFTITCNEPTLPEVLPYTCKVSYALEEHGENLIYQREDTCNHDGISLHQGEKEQGYRLHLLVAGTYLDHLLWEEPLLLTVEPTPVTNEELGNTVDDLSGNLTESATEEEVVEILNDLQSVSITLNTKPPDANITFSNYSATEKEEMAKEENKKVREAVLNTISTINTSSIEIMISVTSTLNQVTLKKDELSTEAKDQAFDMYNTFTEDLKEKEETTSDEDVRKAAGSLLFGIGSVLDMTSDGYIEDDDAIKVTTAAPITKEESKKLVIKKTQQLLDSVETISTIVFKRQDVDSEPAVFESPVMSVAIAKVSPKNLVGKPIKAGDDGDDSRTSMVLPEDMDLSETSDATGGDDSIRTEFLLLKKNPFVWGKNAKHIKAPVVSFELKNSKNDILHVKNLATPIKVQLPHDGGDLAGTIPFVCTLQKVNETIQLNATEYRPCAATFELTIDPRKVTVFSLSLPDDFTVLLSISLTKKFDRLRLSENGTGFRYPTDTHIISKFYSHLSEIEADIFHNAMQYCKACSEICCDTTDICTGIYGHCMYYCKTVLQNPFTENCTGIIDLTVYCDSCQSVCCDGTENCINILENCVFMCAVHLKEKMTTDCKTSLSES
ncbi:uncharacterized protein LOC132714702, partial [Ruditapes philippinarum]|uniref:uncharacterized protein LOC132714702 n=1 Tax=Ruditapes philippinarum TaxID=129788 RepID=UPI00295B8A24